MLAHKAYKFRLYPDTEQVVMFSKTFGCVRSIYNKMLSDKIEHYQKHKENLKVTPAKYKEEFPYLKEVDSLALCNAQLHLEGAYKNFFTKPDSGFPKFKSKRKSRRSYTTNEVNGNIKLFDDTLKLPKIGLVKIVKHRNIPDGYKLKQLTVSQDRSGKYYASILYEYEKIDIPKIIPKNAIGLDFSLPELFVDSEGRIAAYGHFYRKALKKLAREQRKLSKMKFLSHNWEKQRIKVARAYEKVVNQRRDFMHKKSRQIANAYDLVCIESLDMKAMSQCLNFGKSVHDDAYGMFIKMLEYKLLDMGKYLIKVDRFYPSSQLCSVCGYKNTETKNLNVREWTCPNCGSTHKRDINAAINIKNEGQRILLSEEKNPGTLGNSPL